MCGFRFVPIVMLSSAIVWAADPAPSGIQADLAHLGSDNETVRLVASDELLRGGLDAVPALLELINRNSGTAGRMAEHTLMRIVHLAAGSDRQLPLGRLLADELRQREKYGADARKAICRALAFAGDDSNEVVDALYRALNDQETEEMALYAMAHIPGRTTTDALIAGLQISQEPLKIAIMNTLADRPAPQAVPYLLGWLDNDSKAIVDAALNALAHIPEPNLREILLTAAATRKPRGLDHLLTFAETCITAGLREDALAILLPLVDDQELTPSQRSRWLNLLGRLGGEVAMGFIFKTLEDTDTQVRTAALAALAMLPGPDATTAAARKMKAAAGPLKIDLLNVLSRRGQFMTPEAAEIIRETAKTGEPDLRVAAIRTIETAVINDAFGAILLALDDKPGPARDAAIHALNHMPGPFVTRQIIYELRGKPGAKRALFLAALGRRGDPAGLEELSKGVRVPDPAARLAAIQAIGALGHEGGCDALLAVLLSESPVDREAAAAALERLRSDTVTDKLLAAYRTAARENRSILRSLLVRRHRPDVWAALSAESGFITHWWLLGTFPNDANAMFRKAYFPEEKVNLAAENRVDGAVLNWRYYLTPDISGAVNLFNVFKNKDNVGAYAYTEVTVEQAQDALFKIGSDDSIVVWLNGRQVHAHEVRRGLSPDQDQVTVRLVAGVNRILIKILNEQGDWGFCVRLAKPDGEPLTFRQKTP